MLQSFAKLMLIIFCYPLLPAREVGTLYAPAVYAEEESRGVKNIMWTIGWFFLLTYIAEYLEGSDASVRTAGVFLLLLFLVNNLLVGCVFTILGAILVSPLALVAFMIFFGHMLLFIGLEVLAMDPHEYKLMQKSGRRRSHALLSIINRRR